MGHRPQAFAGGSAVKVREFHLCTNTRPLGWPHRGIARLPYTKVDDCAAPEHEEVLRAFNETLACSAPLRRLALRCPYLGAVAVHHYDARTVVTTQVRGDAIGGRVRHLIITALALHLPPDLQDLLHASCPDGVTEP